MHNEVGTCAEILPISFIFVQLVSLERELNQLEIL